MSNTARIAATAANTLTKPLNVEDVFSTYLYTGTGTTLNIVNGIDLDGEGGMVWHKYRGGASDHGIFDTERGVSRKLTPNDASAQTSAFSGYGITAFNSNGYTLGTQYSGENGSGNEVVSWTFRKAPKFFDVVTYTGNGTAGRTVSHNLGSVPGCIIVKSTNDTNNWAVYHRSTGATKRLLLNLTNAEFASSLHWNDTEPTSTEFTVGTSGQVNGSGDTYVAYLFAHNDGDGEFGPTGDQDIIKCGSYTGNGSSSGPEIDLGWEPQWLLIKNASGSYNWSLVDNMRDFRAPTINVGLFDLAPNSSAAESEGRAFGATSTGFKIVDNHAEVNANGSTYIYIAIRRGPMAVPESATDVFATETQGATTPNPPAFTSGFEVDAALFKLTNSPQSWHLAPRLTQNKYMFTDLSDAEQTNSAYDFDFNNGWYDSASVNSAFRSWMWKRAPSFFDVVCYTGNGSAGHTVSHNLGVAPEMMWVKRRNGTGSWAVYHAGIASDAETDYIYLDYNFSANDDATFWNDTAPTASDFTLGNISGVNSNTQTYIAYLFASLAGISKVGSYTGNNTSQTIDCGFSAGARFVIIKRTDFSGSWYLWDSARGIVDGNDPYLLLDTNGAEVSSYDWIDPDNSGFIVNSTTVNASSGNYIFYAIA